MNPSRIDLAVDLVYGLLLLVAIVLIVTVGTGVGIAFGLGTLIAYIVHVVWKMARFDPQWMTQEITDTIEETLSEEVPESVGEQVTENVEETLSEEVDAIATRVEMTDEGTDEPPEEATDEPPDGGDAEPEDMQTTAEEIAADVLDRAEAIAAEYDTEIDTAIEMGHPARAIVNRASEFDTVVIGSHGGSLADRLFIGDVARRVFRRSPVPVTVVR